jgi:hypothetical protein
MNMITLEHLNESILKIDAKIDSLDTKMDAKFEAFEVKVDEKIDELAGMMARGFSDVVANFVQIEERLQVIEENYATKDDLNVLAKNVEYMLDTHTSIFRKDYDNLAGRTKNLENSIVA